MGLTHQIAAAFANCLLCSQIFRGTENSGYSHFWCNFRIPQGPKHPKFYFALSASRGDPAPRHPEPADGSAGRQLSPRTPGAVLRGNVKPHYGAARPRPRPPPPPSGTRRGAPPGPSQRPAKSRSGEGETHGAFPSRTAHSPRHRPPTEAGATARPLRAPGLRGKAPQRSRPAPPPHRRGWAAGGGRGRRDVTCRMGAGGELQGWKIFGSASPARALAVPRPPSPPVRRRARSRTFCGGNGRTVASSRGQAVSRPPRRQQGAGPPPPGSAVGGRAGPGPPALSRLRDPSSAPAERRGRAGASPGVHGGKTTGWPGTLRPRGSCGSALLPRGQGDGCCRTPTETVTK